MANRPTDWHVLDLDRDPVPGDPYEVKELARKLGDFADDVSSALRSVRGLSGNNAVQDWAGLAADAYREQFGDLPGELGKLEKSYRLASGALETYWPKLETAQADADRALAQGRTARQDLDAAKTTQTNANDWVKRAGDKSKEYQADPKPGVEPPSADEVRTATRNALDASNAQKSANTAVHDAQQRLDAAKELAAQAAHLRDTAASTAEHALHEASDAGIKNKHWWEKAVDWVADHWDDIVAVCKVIVAVLGIIVMIIGGPLAWIVLAAALVVLADTLIKYAQGKASLWDVAFAALDCIPRFKGLTTAGGLLKMAKNLPKLMKGMGSHLGDVAGALRKGLPALRKDAKELSERVCEKDPIDVASGEMIMPQTDVHLPGALPLVLERTHVSSYRAGRWFGPSWASTLDQHLEVDDQGVVFRTADGMSLCYPRPQPGLPVLPVVGTTRPLAWDGTAGGSMSVTDPATGRTSHFVLEQPPAAGESARLPLAAITDRNGVRIEITYTDDGVPAEVRHSGGYRIGIETEDQRITALRLLSHEDRPVLQRFGYDTAGNLTRIYNSSPTPFTLEYDAERRITGWEDRNGFWYRYTYDTEGRCTATAGSGGILDAVFSYDDENRTTVVTDSHGHSKTYRMDEAYQVVAVTDELGHTTLSQWDRRDRLLSRTDPLGRTVRYTYDADGNLTTVLRPDGSAARARYNGMGLPIEVVEPGGARWTRAYDERGNPVAIVDPTGAETRFTYDERGHRTSITGPLGHTQLVENDPAGLPVAVTDALGSTRRSVRDPFGRVLRVTDPLGHGASYHWTAEGRLARYTGADGASEVWTWDAEGNLVEHTDQTGRTTRRSWTAFDLPRSRTAPDGTTYDFTHDTERRLTAVTDPLGRTWTYAYDAAGRVVAETDFNGRTLSYEHDAAGRLATRINGSGESLTYTRDTLGRAVRQQAGDGTVTAFAYTPDGQLAGMSNADADVVIERDAAGRILAETVNGRTMTLAYDGAGRTVERRAPSGAVSRWEYDGVGRPAALTAQDTTITFAYDGAGRETERHLGGSATLSQQWDPLSRLTGQLLSTGPESRIVRQRSYAYREDGLLAGITDSVSGIRRFDLDAAGRITGVHGRDWTESYAYDAVGNLTLADSPGAGAEGGERTFTGTLLRHAGRTLHEHDGEGRLVRSTRRLLNGQTRTWTYTWNSEDRLVEVVTPDDTTWRYRYDPLGRRTAKERLAGDGSVAGTTLFTWDGTRLAEQVTADGTATTWDYAPGTHRPVSQSTGQAEVDRRFYAIVTDLTGTPTELVGPDGDIAWHLQTTLWGGTVPGGGSTQPADCPLRFPGQYLDDETGLHYNFQRYYDPAAARFASPDPLGLEAAPNHHAYVPNPFTWTDPLGLKCLDAADQARHDAARSTAVDEHGNMLGVEDATGVRIIDAQKLQDVRADLHAKLGPPEVKTTPKGDIELWRLSDDPKATVTYRPFSASQKKGLMGGPTIDYNDVDKLDMKRFHAPHP
ncbi:RHS repeat-associated core domain-containing protein [Streptomyces sp. H39-C1]|uniref:RHS repeat-associated core domain-containing protein n=1 Tax=Streptomyces sp. H39-C1 TaxID=3004355 RepID=UPI0022B06708|nr:RHS repeat-associated core domain-containing protein [Streptomyces sp. H39-C1]MCZ4096207.1 DUF6531 domain-containing protein [Streptomyces sp. H39-C1]